MYGYDFSNIGGFCIEVFLFLGLGWATSSWTVVSLFFYGLAFLRVVLGLLNLIDGTKKWIKLLKK